MPFGQETDHAYNTALAPMNQAFPVAASWIWIANTLLDFVITAISSIKLV